MKRRHFIAGSLFLSLLVNVAAFGQDSSNQVQIGRLLRIKLPITGSVDIRIKRSVDQVLENLPKTDPRPALIFEFTNPNRADQSRSEFERCLSLARYLTSSRFSEVRTIAYIPDSVTSHAVLVAIACEEIIVAEDAIFGDAGRGESSLGVTLRGGYKEISEHRGTVPSALALGMLDKDLEVLKLGLNNNSYSFVLAEDVKTIEANQLVRTKDVLFKAGAVHRLRGDEMRELGFASYIANNRAELARVLNIPVENLEFDPSLGGVWRAIRVELNGPVTATAVDRIINAIQQQQELRQVNFVSFEIRSEGGSPLQSIRLANFLADLDRSEIRTLAYIPKEARSDAALIAFACDHVVVNADAVVGGDGAATINGQDIADLRAPIEAIAQKKSLRWSLPVAMVDPDIKVFEFSNKDNSRRAFLSEAEFIERFGDGAEDASRPDGWLRGSEITLDGEVLKLDGTQAHDVGFARFVVDGYDEVKQIYQLEETPELVGPNWAYELVEVLASPQVAGGLLFIGIFALYIEISSPGLGIGGFVATVCFVLYFWANFMHGTAEVLEIMLFILGVIFLLIEIFVLPGFGIFGLGGGILIVASLILATQTFIIPTNDYQMNQLPKSMLTVVSSFAGVIFCGILLRKYIHRAPILGRVMLNPPEGDEADELHRRESLVDYEHLLGQTGSTSTRLSPAGKAMFHDQLVDVVSDGDLIEKNQKIRVIEVFGNRVVVELIS